MKRLVELIPADLENVAVWRYDGETDETAVVHATDRHELAGNTQEVFIARTQFALANGVQFIGFCCPVDDSALDYLQPVIVTPEGPVYFWFDEPPSREFLHRQWRKLGVPPDDIFPVHFRCTVPIDGRMVWGVIEAVDLTGPA